MVTGASAGIGAQFGRTPAGHGSDLVLVSRSEQVLHALAADVRARHGVRVDILVADPTVENAATTLRQQVGALGLQVDLLINIAGFATAGRFELLDPPPTTPR